MLKLFTEHPKQVGEGYFTHCCYALMSGLKLFAAGFICIVHAIFPFLFKTTVSDLIIKMARVLSQRRHSEVDSEPVSGKRHKF